MAGRRWRCLWRYIMLTHLIGIGNLAAALFTKQHPHSEELPNGLLDKDRMHELFSEILLVAV